MTVCIFLGPTLRVESAREILDAVYLPPAAHGDIYRLTLRSPKPRAIGLIDGAFRHRPAVRHKEILWAMSEGIHVFGAASMGALRAAELADFGMVGIGQVFVDFRDGRLEDDDEVAVDHGPAEIGHPPTNDAMVDMRATLDAARRQGIIKAATERLLTDLAKQRFYPERNYRKVVGVAMDAGADATELDRLLHWLTTGKMSRKRDDAVSLLKHLKVFLASDPPPLAVTYRFERTEMWENDIRFAAPAGDGKTTLERDFLLDELRLRPDLLEAVKRDALGLALSRREAERAGVTLASEEIAAFRRDWLERNDLTRPEKLESWSRDNGLDTGGFHAYIATAARDAKLAHMARDVIADRMIDALRMRGEYPDLARAAETRRALLASGDAHARRQREDEQN